MEQRHSIVSQAGEHGRLVCMCVCACVCTCMESRAKLRRDLYESRRAGKLWSSPAVGQRSPRALRTGSMIAQRGSALLRTAWQDPEGVAPGWAGSPTPEPGRAEVTWLARDRRIGFLCCLSGWWRPDGMWRRLPQPTWQMAAVSTVAW